MACYDIYESGFNNLNETINFGVRAIGDDKSLYEICTLAVIRSSLDTLISDELKITSYYEIDGKIFTGINNCLRIIKSLEQPDPIASFEFEHNLDNISVSPCGKYVLVCTRNGQILIRDLSLIIEEKNGSFTNEEKSLNRETSVGEEIMEYECPSVFTETIDCAPIKYAQNCFIATFVRDVSELIFYVVTCTGLVKSITLKKGEAGGQRFVSEVVNDLRGDFRIGAFAYPFLCLEGRELLILDLRNNNCDIDDALGLKSLHAIGHNFLGFDNEDNVYKIDSARCLIFGINNELPYLVDAFDSLMVLADDDKRSVVGITKNDRKIRLWTFLDSNLVYDIPLQHKVHLINTKGVTEQVLFVMEVRQNGLISELRLQYVTEADPELRVKKLIQKGFIDKAELVARTFNVKPEFVAEAKAEHIVEKVECTTEEIDELLTIFETLPNHLFRMQCCDSVICKTATDTRRILCHGAFMEIDVRDCRKNENNLLLVMKRKFNRRLRRFDTYTQVYLEYDKRKWNYFADCNLIEEVIIFLKQNKPEKATLIFSRLDHKEIVSLTDDIVEEVLNINQPMNAMSFLNTFIPVTLKYRSNTLVILVKWIHHRVYQMEKENDFPGCAIKFLEDVTRLMNINVATRGHLGDECREVLANLLKALNNSQMLVNNFSIKLPLAEYVSDPHDMVRTLLNLELEPTHLERLMEKFLYPLMLKCGVDVDTLILEQMQDLFIYDEEYWLNIAQVLLKFVGGVDKRLKAIKEILEIAVKPWSDKVKDIAQMTFEYPSTCPIVEDISDLLRDEGVLVVLEKYKIRRHQFVSMSDKLFYLRRILYLNRNDCDQAIKDINRLCRDDEDRLQADLLMLKEFIKRGYLEKAMTVLDQLESQKMFLVGKELLEYVLLISEQEIVPLKYRQAFQASLNPLWHRLSRSTKGGEKKDVFYMYQVANAVYGLYSHFGILPNISVLNFNKREHILVELFQKVTCFIEEEEFAIFDVLIRNCKKIASCFGDTLENILLKFMKCGNNFNMLVHLGKYLLESSECVESLTLCAVYLFKYSNEAMNNIQDETFLDVVVAANKNNTYDELEAMQVARKLCIKSLTFSSDVDQTPILEFLRWIESCYYLTNVKENLIFHSDVHQIYLPTSKPYYFAIPFEAMKLMNVALVGAQGIDNLKYLTYFRTDKLANRKQFRQDLDQFMWRADDLLKQEQYLTVLNMIQVIQHSSLSYPDAQTEVLHPLQQFIQDKVLPDTIKAVLSHKFLDKTLLFNLMLLFEKDKYEEQLTRCLTIYKRRPIKLNIITQVGLNLISYHGVNHGKGDLLNILNLCKWWFRINDPKMKYETYFTSKAESRLETLLKEEKVTLENLPEYCTDFGLNLQNYYLKYLKIILLNWQPDLEFITEVSGKKNIVIKNSENELISKCSKVLNCISDKNEVFKLTEQVWPLINYYYYEVYLALLFVHLHVAPSGGTISSTYKPLLYFLKTYKRVSSPTRLEIEQWCDAFPSKSLIDPLSEFRLPLTSTFLSKDIFHIIEQEVNLDTYKEWFRVSTILKQYLNQQDICIYAINSPLSSGHVTCDTWELSLKYDYLVSKVDECAQNISDLEQATDAVYKLMCGMPPGADKVKMAELSYKFAKRYREATNTNGKVEKFYSKIKQSYLNYCAIHILHKYQLAEDKYFEQVAQPSDLIWELYNDSRIETYFDNLIFNCPDINKAVEELCTLFGLNIKRETINVLVKLLKSNSPLNLDCTQLQSGSESIHLKRACYLCKNQDVTNWQQFLIEQGIKISIENDMSFRVNALCCFYHISDAEAIEAMSNMSPGQFVTYLNKVSVIAKMGDLGLKFDTVTQLDQQNHKRLLKSLAKVNKPLAIKCIASLCRIYEMDDLKYWEYIVNCAIQFQMLRELREYLEFLRDRCVNDCIKNAWHIILSDVFSHLSNHTLSEAEVFLLLQTCPVIYELNIEVYIQKCILIERPDIANILRQFKK